MSKMTQKGLEKTVKHYTQAGDYQSARNYIENFGDEFKTFDKETALKSIEEAEKGKNLRRNKKW